MRSPARQRYVERSMDRAALASGRTAYGCLRGSICRATTQKLKLVPGACLVMHTWLVWSCIHVLCLVRLLCCLACQHPMPGLDMSGIAGPWRCLEVFCVIGPGDATFSATPVLQGHRWGDGQHRRGAANTRTGMPTPPVAAADPRQQQQHPCLSGAHASSLASYRWTAGCRLLQRYDSLLAVAVLRTPPWR